MFVSKRPKINKKWPGIAHLKKLFEGTLLRFFSEKNIAFVYFAVKLHHVLLMQILERFKLWRLNKLVTDASQTLST